MANPNTPQLLTTLSSNFGGDGVSTMGASAEPGFFQGQVVYRKSDYDLTQGGGHGKLEQLPFVIVALVQRQINVAGVTNTANAAGTAATSATQDGPTSTWWAYLQRINVDTGELTGRGFPPVHVSELYTLTTLQSAVGGTVVGTWTDPTPDDFAYNYWPSS